MRGVGRAASVLLSVLGIAAATAQSRGHRSELIGIIHDPAISEISGATVAQHDQRHLFAINDSQNSATLHVLSHDGSAEGQVHINNAENRDWEDLAAFTLNGRPYLLIADTGDNGGLRASLTLYIVAEPKLPLPESIDIQWRIRFRLPEGPRDIEAVAVDAASASIYLIAKRHFPRVLYRLPLRPADPDVIQLAERVGTFNALPPASNIEKNREPKFGRFQGDITSLALDPERRYALLLSYRDLYFYRRAAGESLLQSLARKPRRKHLPPIPQAEAIALDADDGYAIVVSERLLAPIYRVAIP